MRRRIRTSSALTTSLALLSTAAITSSSSSSSSLSNNPLLAFTTAPPPANNRIRRKLLARTIFQASSSNTNDNHQSEFTRYTAAATTKKEQEQRSSTNDVANSGIANPSSTLSMMVDEQREFEINLGRAVDTLKQDYPKLLTNDPSWNIYHSDLEVIDPTGVSLHGLSNYKRAFSFIHAVVYMFYCEEKSGLTFRSTYDWARKAIR